MFLARTLGRTVAELEDSMSAEEFGDWAALWALEREGVGGAANADAAPVEEEMDVREFLKRTGKNG